MDRFEFLVQGSSAEPYEVIIQREGNDLKANCTCPAGSVGQYCKHRFAILSGDASNVIKGADNVKRAAALMPGTDVDRSWKVMLDAEAKLESAKRELFAAKKQLARTMSS